MRVWRLGWFVQATRGSGVCLGMPSGFTLLSTRCLDITAAASSPPAFSQAGTPGYCGIGSTGCPQKAWPPPLARWRPHLCRALPAAAAGCCPGGQQLQGERVAGARRRGICAKLETQHSKQLRACLPQVKAVAHAFLLLPPAAPPSLLHRSSTGRRAWRPSLPGCCCCARASCQTPPSAAAAWSSTGATQGRPV